MYRVLPRNCRFFRQRPPVILGSVCRRSRQLELCRWRWPTYLVARKERSSKLLQRQEELAHAGLRVTIHEPTGSVVEEILKTADAIAADLIVMGSHGHGSVYNLLVGSVTEGVLKISKRPVLLVPTATNRS